MRLSINTRSLHRDLGYFYVGLIISFAISGIMLNHRESWHPEKYTTNTTQIQVGPIDENTMTENAAKKIVADLKIDDKFRRQNIKNGALRISLEQHDIEIDLATGKGEVVEFIKTPIISQSIKLHKSTSNWWIYYSDIFGLSLVVIAITGATMIKYGNFTFRKYGWKLALAGLIFPILFLVFLG